ncbi:MAG: HD domain-containing protein [Oscillospiraceae bacterium]|jgi:HD superfamily phosphodiesterase|nr:HD domain-containing protein [Oscillospiraceae bacterium]
MESRLKKVQDIVDAAIAQSADPRKHCVHACGVSSLSALLAQKRGISAELASVAGLLHDISAVKSGGYDNHCVLGAETASEILGGTGLFTVEETAIISRAILYHDGREDTNGPYDEVLKDADCAAPYLCDVTKPVSPTAEARVRKVLAELGVVNRNLV